MKPVRISGLADADIDEALEQFAGAPRLVDRLVKSFDEALRRVAALPASGSPRYGLQLNIEELRTQPTPRFPYLIFYVERATEIVVLRILHQKRDLATIISDE